MKVDGRHYRTIWIEPSSGEVTVIDQQVLPHCFETITVGTYEDMARVIKNMRIRGAGLVGAAAGAGMHLAARAHDAQSCPPDRFMAAMEAAGKALRATRPTAVNLEWAVKRQLAAMSSKATVAEKQRVAAREAQAIMDEDADWCRRIGEHGVAMIERLAASKGPGEAVNILTHCNAGWLAFVDYGSATAPIYAAHDKGIKVHVYVGETRPRNQGAALTAWELGKHGVPHTVIADNAGGHLMQHGKVDMVITGADRVLSNGDVCNKVGTYLKALAAHDNKVPMVVALPSSTFDWDMRNGVADVPIEQRDGSEVKHVQGLLVGVRGTQTPIRQGLSQTLTPPSIPQLASVLVCPADSPAANWAFDVTPSRLVDYLITERGVCTADRFGVYGLYPERRKEISRL
eukprot:m.35723 g.35723  ORF g.35723 m.35723 type:complete len:401 (+) comp5317_c0_seq1:85-1287(+)